MVPHVPGLKPASRRAQIASSTAALILSARSLQGLERRELAAASASGRRYGIWASGRRSDIPCSGAAVSVLVLGGLLTTLWKTGLYHRRSRASAALWTKARSPPWTSTSQSPRHTGILTAPPPLVTTLNQHPIPLIPTPALEVTVATNLHTPTLPPVTATGVTQSPHPRCPPHREKHRENPQGKIVTAAGDAALGSVSGAPRMDRSGSSQLYLRSLVLPQTPIANPRLEMYHDRRHRLLSFRRLQNRRRSRSTLVSPGKAARLISASG